MKDLRNDANVIGEYLNYLDEHYQDFKGDAYFHKRDDEDFLLIQSYGNFLKEFNLWARESKYYERLVEETRHDCGNDEDWWIDYLTEGNYGYDDMYSACTECDNIILTNPTSGIADNYWINGYGILCEHCIRENQDEYVKEYLTVNYETGVPNINVPLNYVFSKSELEDMGFELYKEDLEIGMYGVYNDPRKILKELTETYKETDFICHCTSDNPFATYYEIWKRGGEEQKYTDKIYGGKFAYEEMVENAKENYDYGDETNYLTYVEDWWKEYYREI